MGFGFHIDDSASSMGLPRYPCGVSWRPIHDTNDASDTAGETDTHEVESNRAVAEPDCNSQSRR